MVYFVIYEIQTFDIPISFDNNDRLNIFNIKTLYQVL